MAVGLIAPAPLRQVRIGGGTLFRVALDELGDATQWNRIAVLNGLTDPWLDGGSILTLNIPPRQANPTSRGALNA